MAKIPVHYSDCTLTLMAGLPYSGKTAWIEQNRWAGLVVVSPDAIRLALTNGLVRFTPGLEPFVWAGAAVMARSLFLAGHRAVVIDATHATEKRRTPWIEEAQRLDIKLRLIHVIATPLMCLSRAQAAGDEAILDSIERMARQWEDPPPDVWNRVRVEGDAEHGTHWYELL